MEDGRRKHCLMSVGGMVELVLGRGKVREPLLLGADGGVWKQKSV